jgi:uncharacterized protein YbjT (DUF2867 family)
MKVLIVGASGFIGSYARKALREKGHSLILISRNPEKLGKIHQGETAFSLSEIEKAFSLKPEVVLNTAGILKEEKGVTYEEVHWKLTENLVSLSKKFKVKKFVLVSALGVSEREKSRYFTTKWKGEEAVRNSELEYAILRPSIVLGKGQKLYEDLKRLSRFLPVLGAPKMKVQPVRIEKVMKAIVDAVECRLKGTVELCGEEVLTMKELFKRVLKELGIRRPVIEVPKFLLFPLALLKVGGLDLEQYKMIKDNVCKGEEIGRVL